MGATPNIENDSIKLLSRWKNRLYIYNRECKYTRNRRVETRPFSVAFLRDINRLMNSGRCMDLNQFAFPSSTLCSLLSIFWYRLLFFNPVPYVNMDLDSPVRLLHPYISALWNIYYLPARRYYSIHERLTTPTGQRGHSTCSLCCHWEDFADMQFPIHLLHSPR